MHGLAIERGPVVYTGIETKTDPITPRAGAKAAPHEDRPIGIVGKLAWCTAGFLAGAAFWHFVGFWGFISAVVLGGPDPERELFSARPISIVSPKGSDLAPTLAGKARVGSACVALALDRVSGQTRRVPCESQAPVLPHVPTAGREDLALLPASSVPTILPKFGEKSAVQTAND
jgi:hypothetical protein